MPIDLNDHLVNDGTALVLHGAKDLRDSDLAQLRRFTGAQRRLLTVVVLSRTQVTGACLEHLACLPHLRTLYLNGTQISDQHHFELSGSSLEMVNLDNTSLGDLGVARLSRATNLRTVRLCNTQVTDRGVQMLQTFPGLREYYLDRTPTSAHAKRRLDNAINLARIDSTGALWAIGRQMELGARTLARLATAPVDMGWAREWMPWTCEPPNRDPGS